MRTSVHSSPSTPSIRRPHSGGARSAITDRSRRLRRRWRASAAAPNRAPRCNGYRWKSFGQSNLHTGPSAIRAASNTRAEGGIGGHVGGQRDQVAVVLAGAARPRRHRRLAAVDAVAEREALFGAGVQVVADQPVEQEPGRLAGRGIGVAVVAAGEAGIDHAELGDGVGQRSSRTSPVRMLNRQRCSRACMRSSARNRNARCHCRPSRCRLAPGRPGRIRRGRSRRRPHKRWGSAARRSGRPRTSGSVSVAAARHDRETGGNIAVEARQVDVVLRAARVPRTAESR